jgi:hypothetical protein
VLVGPDDTNAVDESDVLDQRPLALGQNGVVRGVPRDRQTPGDPGDRQLHDDALQRPPQPAARQLRPAAPPCSPGLLLALAVKVLLGDAFGDAGARQLVTDVPVLLAVGVLFRFALLGARRATGAPRVA